MIVPGGAIMRAGMGAYPHSETAPRPGNGGSAAPTPIPPRGAARRYPHSGPGASHSRGWVAEWARGRDVVAPCRAVRMRQCDEPHPHPALDETSVTHDRRLLHGSIKQLRVAIEKPRAHRCHTHRMSSIITRDATCTSFGDPAGLDAILLPVGLHPATHPIVH